MEQALHGFDRYDELQYGYQTDLLRILYYDLPENYSENYAAYESPKLCTVLEGQKNVRAGIKENFFTHDRSEMLLLPAHSRVEIQIPVPTRALVFELSDQLIARLHPVVEEELCTSITIDNGTILRCAVNHQSRDLQHTIQRIRRHLSLHDEDRRFLIDLAAQELTYHLLHVHGAEQVLKLDRSDPVHQAIRDINDHISTIHHIRDLASHYQMSHTNFTSRFKKLTGLTPREYITNRKLEEARHMLRHHTVTEVAMSLQYDNISHFIGLFRKKYGVTPKQYQLGLHPSA